MQNIPTIKAGGGTPLGTAINLSLDCIENRKKEYKQKGVQYYQPWLVVMSDGRPGSEKQREMARAKLRTEELTQNRKLVLLSIGIGDKADMEFMKALSKSCGRLKDMRFRDFFIWLSQSVTSTSHSNAAMIAIERPSGAFFEAY